MEGEDVDRPSLSIDRERRLDQGFPTIAAEQPDSLLDEQCMRCVQQSIEALTPPSQRDIESRVESVGDSSQRCCADASAEAAFDVRDNVARNARSLGEIDLAPAETDAERRLREPETDPIMRGAWASTVHRRSPRPLPSRNR